MKHVAHRKVVSHFTELVLMAGAVALTGCGGDDKNDGGGGGGGDCSKCAEADKADCQSTYSECLKAGESKANCQSAADLVCSFSGAFGDGGPGGNADGG